MNMKPVATVSINAETGEEEIKAVPASDVDQVTAKVHSTVCQSMDLATNTAGAATQHAAQIASIVTAKITHLISECKSPEELRMLIDTLRAEPSKK